MRIAPPVIIDRSQQQTLKQWARSRSRAARQIERAKVVLLAAEGKADVEIATSLNISNQKAARWQKRFLQVRFGGLGERCTPSWAKAGHLHQDQRGVDP
jgi:hypothetical protein